MKLLKILLVGLCLGAVSGLWAQSNPIPTLQQVSDHIINNLKANKSQLKQNKQIIYRSVEQNLLPIVDVEGMARSVLGRQAWTRASAAERQAFSEAFTKLVIRTYANPLAEYSDEVIQFNPVRGNLDNRFLKVNSIIVRSKGNNIPLNYSLVSKNGQWKIYDLSVEGVSLLQSFRSQFAQALQNASLKDLIHQMNTQGKVAS